MKYLTRGQVEQVGLLAISMDDCGYFAKYELGGFFESSTSGSPEYRPTWEPVGNVGAEFKKWTHQEGCDCEFCR